MVHCSSGVLSLLGEAAVLDKFHDHWYQVSVRIKPQKLAGQATMPHSVIDCSEVHKDSTSLLLSGEAVLDFLSHQSDLIYSRSSVLEACLLTWEQEIDDRLDGVVNEPLEDHVVGQWLTQGGGFGGLKPPLLKPNLFFK